MEGRRLPGRHREAIEDGGGGDIGNNRCRIRKVGWVQQLHDQYRSGVPSRISGVSFFPKETVNMQV
jgi:hypothetical protein